MMRAVSIILLSMVAMPGIARAENAAHIEVYGGYDSLQNDGLFNYPVTRFRPVRGAVYGIGAGYDLAIGGRGFAGLQATFDGSTGKRCQVNPAILAPGIFETCIRADHDIGANVRVGVALAEKRLRLYGLAGYSNARLTTSFQINRAGESGFASRNLDGLRLGLGAEYDIVGRAYGKLEYRYTNYRDGFSRNQALAGVGIRF
jgi:outer membrane immunogenic protein